MQAPETHLILTLVAAGDHLTSDFCTEEEACKSSSPDWPMESSGG